MTLIRTDIARSADWLRCVGMPIAKAVDAMAYDIVPGPVELPEAADLAETAAALCRVLADKTESLDGPGMDASLPVSRAASILSAICQTVWVEYRSSDRERVNRASWIACLVDELASDLLRQIIALTEEVERAARAAPETVADPTAAAVRDA